MKIIRERPKDTLKGISLQLPTNVIALVDKAAAEAKLSRQKLIALLLEQALTDPRFVLRVRE